MTCQSGAHKDVLNMYQVVTFEMSDLLYLCTVKLQTVVNVNLLEFRFIQSLHNTAN